MSKYYTAQVVQAIETSLRLGNTRRAAAAYAGINRDTLYEWLKDETRMTFEKVVTQKDGRGQDVTRTLPPLLFRDMVQQAEADGQNSCVAIIRKAAQGGALKSERTYTRRDGTVVTEKEYALPQWTAAAWLLERKNPEEWAQKKREVDDLSKYSDDEILAMIAANGEDTTLGTYTDSDDPQAPKRIAGPPGYTEPVEAAQVIGRGPSAQSYLEANTRRAGVQEPATVSA